MEKTPKVTLDNVKLCEEAKAELIEHLEDLVNMTKRYPVECVFGDFRRVFANREDILAFIDELTKGIDLYKAAAA